MFHLQLEFAGRQNQYFVLTTPIELVLNPAAAQQASGIIDRPTTQPIGIITDREAAGGEAAAEVHSAHPWYCTFGIPSTHSWKVSGSAATTYNQQVLSTV